MGNEPFLHEIIEVSLFRMKKLLVAITLTCYLAFTGGVVVNFHFCMDKLASTQFYGGDSKICGKCGMHKDPNGCCQDEVMVVKIVDDQQASTFATGTSDTKFSIELPYFVSIPAIAEDLIKGEWQNHSPPLLNYSPLYLQNGVFRI